MGDAEVTASNWRSVEVGRIAFFGSGPYTARVAAIVQIVDHKRVLVEGPSDKPELAVPRHAAPLSSLSLTGIVIDKLPNAVGSGALKKKWAEAEIDQKWTNSSYAKKLDKQARRKQLSDFERFKVMRLRKQARFETRKALAQAKASA
ncbi:probable 60S ribosomal L14-A [Lecanosticta acicola]|uniref:Probable 60S ribosomal L14-A n=1 Tax=Lecanosticta acicola TaxID=111012 RepID=A0AAI9ECX5_9PEZI|nr:probable 60S ribosomal L14-A [Lecanosticta acicola]